MVKQAKIVRVVNEALIEVEFRARDNKRGIDGGVGVHVCIVEFELIGANWSIFVCAGIIELRECRTGDHDDG